jgi:hypothetical protein
MKTFNTPKGSQLQIIQLKGKDYLQVAQRLIWFREEHPDWSITTEAVTLDEKHAIFRATIQDATGRTIATAHKREDQAHFGDCIEKAETGSIGRALAYCGYGTQFCADELDEGSRIVDAPIDAKPSSQGVKTVRSVEAVKPAIVKPHQTHEDAAGTDFTITFGVYKGKTVGALGMATAKSYADHLLRQVTKRNTQLSPAESEFIKFVTDKSATG